MLTKQNDTTQLVFFFQTDDEMSHVLDDQSSDIIYSTWQPTSQTLDKQVHPSKVQTLLSRSTHFTSKYSQDCCNCLVML